MLHMPSYILFWVLILNSFFDSITRRSPFHCCVFWKAVWKHNFSVNQQITILQLLTPTHAPPPGSGVLLEALLTLPPQAGLGARGQTSNILLTRSVSGGSLPLACEHLEDQDWVWFVRLWPFGTISGSHRRCLYLGFAQFSRTDWKQTFITEGAEGSDG